MDQQERHESTEFVNAITAHRSTSRRYTYPLSILRAKRPEDERRSRLNVNPHQASLRTAVRFVSPLWSRALITGRMSSEGWFSVIFSGPGQKSRCVGLMQAARIVETVKPRR